MPVRLKNRLKFRLERWLQRGALFQLLVIAGMIVGVAILGGLVAWAFSGAFGDPAEAIWWAFLRLSDPGYLGDDQGMLLRIISTVVTVLGYVLFMGSMIAILTQWLNATMRTLERGFTPIVMRDHILILGWTNRTAAIVRELLLSEGRVRRFLRLHGVRRLRIVILAERVDVALAQELRDHLGPHWDRRRVILRSGSSLRIEHLRRVSYRDAAAILLPGDDFRPGGAVATDARTIKTLLSIANQEPDGETDSGPVIVAELHDAFKVPIAQQAYEGELDLIAGDAFVSRLIAQNVRHRGLSYVYGELLSHAEGNEVYIRPAPQLAGTTLSRAAEAFPNAVLLGAVRNVNGSFRPYLNPPPDFRFERDDQMVLIARDYTTCAPVPVGGRTEAEHGPTPRHRTGAVPRRRLLCLGWSHKVVALLRELDGYPSERFQVDVLSVVPAEERRAHLARHPSVLTRVDVHHTEGDYTQRNDLLAADPASYDNIIFLGSDWLASDEESDARTILGYVLLQAILPSQGRKPDVLVELMDPENAGLFRERSNEVIISPMVMSHVLAHVVLRRELNVVFSELFGPGGAEIFFHPVEEYGLLGQEVDFRTVRRSVLRRGDIALGIRRLAGTDEVRGGVYVNPPADRSWRFEEGDEVVVLTTT